MDIETIVENIDQKKCILVLGPDIAFNSEKSMLNELSDFFGTKRVKHEFHENEELFSSNTKFKPLAFMNVPKFFDGLEITELHQQIAEIPFHLIVSLSPDLLLQKAFDEKNFDFTADYYHKGKAPQEIEKPTPEKPLIYNLLGTYKQTTSMVLCFNHLFDYLSSILGDYKLHDNLRTELDEALTVFFLGFKYDKWYFKLIMRLLNKDDEVLRQASFQEVQDNEEVINFYTDEFGFYFEDELSGAEIIKEIHTYYADKGALRQPKPEEQASGNVININDSSNVTILQNVEARDVKLS